MILLSQLLECWDHWCVPAQPISPPLPSLSFPSYVYSSLLTCHLLRFPFLPLPSLTPFLSIHSHAVGTNLKLIMKQWMT